MKNYMQLLAGLVSVAGLTGLGAMSQAAPQSVAPASGRLVYYTTFDSAAAVETPAAGPTGVCWNASFQSGVKGQALYVPAGGGTLAVPFDQGLPGRKGCIEFWAKILPEASTFTGSGNPCFFMFNRRNTDAHPWFNLSLTTNDGGGRSGWYAAVASFWKTSREGIVWGSLGYDVVFGELDYREWHHYVLRWNLDGLCGDVSKAFDFTLDDMSIMDYPQGVTDEDLFLSRVAEPLDLLFAAPQNTRVPENYRVPFLIDEFKVWDSDVAGVAEPDPESPVDETNDGVDEVDGVTWYYTLDENGAATIVKGAVPYAGDLTTPQKLDGHDVVALADSAFIDCEGLTSLVVSDGVVTIGSGAVARCANLVRAVLPDSATNIVESCFYECFKLADVRLPAWLPQLSAFFFKGTAITSLVIPEGVTRLGHDVFLDCTSLESVTLPSTLTFIDWSGFQNASALKTIEFPEGFEGFGAWTLRDEKHAAFGYCRALETTVFHGPLPTNFDASWLMKLGCKIYFPKAYAADWESVVTLASFGGYTEDLEIDPAPGPGGDDPAPGPGGDDPAPGPGGDDPAPGPGGDDPAPGPEGGDPAPGPGPVVDPEPEPEPEPEPMPEPPTLSFEGEPAGTTISVVAYKGVEMKLPVAFGAVQSVKVSGLPSGITYKDGNLVGVPKTASRRVRKTGGYQAKKATFTVKLAEGKKKYFAEIAVVPRAGWCEGSFDGAVFADGLCAGPVQLKLGANGKASGRFTTVQGGKAVVVALKGAALAAYDEVAKTAAFDVVLKGGGLDGRSVRLAVGVNELGLGVVTGEGMTLVQNGWKAKRPDFPVLPAGQAALTVSCESGLVLKLGATGQVKVSGKVAGDDGTPVAVRGTALLVPTAMSGSGLEAETVVFVKPKKNLSRGLVDVVSLRLVGTAAAEAK